MDIKLVYNPLMFQWEGGPLPPKEYAELIEMRRYAFTEEHYLEMQWAVLEGYRFYRSAVGRNYNALVAGHEVMYVEGA